MPQTLIYFIQKELGQLWRCSTTKGFLIIHIAASWASWASTIE